MKSSINVRGQVERRSLSRLFLLSVFACLLALSGCKEQKLALGETAPALAAYDLAGEKVSLQKWQGKPVFLTFWSSTCSGCLAEFPLLDKLNAQYGDRVSIVSVNTDRPEVDIAPLVEQYNLSFAVVRDQLGITQERYEIIGTPTAFLLDRQGKIVAQYVGMQKDQQLTDIIESAALE